MVAMVLTASTVKIIDPKIESIPTRHGGFSFTIIFWGTGKGALTTTGAATSSTGAASSTASRATSAGSLCRNRNP